MENISANIRREEAEREILVGLLTMLRNEVRSIDPKKRMEKMIQILNDLESYGHDPKTIKAIKDMI